MLLVEQYLPVFGYIYKGSVSAGNNGFCGFACGFANDFDVELFGDILFQGDADSLFRDELFTLCYSFGRTVSQYFQLIIRLTD